MLGVIVKGLEEKERQKKKRKTDAGGGRKEGRKVTSDSWGEGRGVGGYPKLEFLTPLECSLSRLSQSFSQSPSSPSLLPSLRVIGLICLH